MSTNIINTSKSSILLEVNNLKVQYIMSRDKIVKAVDDVSFQVHKGEALGIVGESGSGKSTLARAILRAVDRPGKIIGGSINFLKRNLLQLSENEMRRIRGKEISMVFQDPTTSMDHLFTLGDQLRETITVHERLSKNDVDYRIVETLGKVGLSENLDEILHSHPSEHSAGFRQRILIALAMICHPYLVIADEPTTTLGATVQAQVLASLDDIRKESGTAVIFITHDFGVVSQFTDNVIVMYAGKCVESGTKKDLLLHPRHPYTVGLIRSVPLIEARKSSRLKSISGFPPDMLNVPPGCPFAPRCDFSKPKCQENMPPLLHLTSDHLCACYYPLDFDTKEELVLEKLA